MVKQVISPPIERFEKFFKCPYCGKHLSKIEVMGLSSKKAYICKKCGKVIL